MAKCNWLEKALNERINAGDRTGAMSYAIGVLESELNLCKYSTEKDRKDIIETIDACLWGEKNA